MNRAALILALSSLPLAMACGGSGGAGPTTPSTPVATIPQWNLTGSVRGSSGVQIAGAVVTVLDGPNNGRQATSDVAGRYGFSGLQQGGFTLRASASGFQDVQVAVTLTENRVEDFQLPRQATAAFTVDGNLVFSPRGDGGADVFGNAINTGDGCATSVGGTTSITSTSNGSVADFVWGLSPSTRVILPAERFEYFVVHLSRDQYAQLAAGGSYRTRFTFSAAACQ